MAAGEERQLWGQYFDCAMPDAHLVAALGVGIGGRYRTIHAASSELATEFYSSATRGRSASHHLQVKAALAQFYRVLAAPNPFAGDAGSEVFGSKRRRCATIRRCSSGQLLLALRADWQSYFGQLTYHLALALFFTGCRFHEWAKLTADRLVCSAGGAIVAARMRVKGGTFRDLPLSDELSVGLQRMAGLPGRCVRGHRRARRECGLRGVAARLFPGRDGRAINAKHSSTGASSAPAFVPACR